VTPIFLSPGQGKRPDLRVPGNLERETTAASYLTSIREGKETQMATEANLAQRGWRHHVRETCDSSLSHTKGKRRVARGKLFNRSP